MSCCLSRVIRRCLAALIGLCVVTCPSWSLPARADDSASSTEGNLSQTAASVNSADVAIFDGKTLEGWRIIEDADFKQHGDVHVKDGVIILPKGKPATGISWKGQLPRSNYEVTFAGQRVDGGDFFCGLTFPVKEEYCTLILGGWGGQVIGLSNIDGYSAIENSTTQSFDLKNETWYKIMLRVTDGQITAEIDGKTMVDVATEGHRFSIWWEQEPVTPLGIVTWHTTGAIKDLKLKKLPAQTSEESAQRSE